MGKRPGGRRSAETGGADLQEQVRVAREQRQTPKKKPARLEFNFDEADPVYAEILQAARDLHITPQLYMHLIFVARHNARHGEPFLEHLWPAQPGLAAAGVVSRAEAPPEPPPTDAGAGALADEWM